MHLLVNELYGERNCYTKKWWTMNEEVAHEKIFRYGNNVLVDIWTGSNLSVSEDKVFVNITYFGEGAATRQPRLIGR